MRISKQLTLKVSMDILLKNATIVAPDSEYNSKKMDILIQNGKISKISKSIKTEASYKLIQSDNLCVSPGWFDPTVSFGEPGFEENETLQSGMKAAAAGGYTAVGLLPNTKPVIDSKSDVEFIIRRSENSLVKIYPIGALSKAREGREISESYDMYQSGAIAFGDDKSVENEKLMEISLLYNKTIGAPTMSFPDSEKLTFHGQMNEGEMSTNLGLKGIPSLSEELRVARDIFLCEYTDGKLYFQNISTEKSAKLVKEAKAKGLEIYSQVAGYNLALSDDELFDFNTNFKVLPPLRNNKEVKAMVKAVKSGVVDVISSDHRPKDVERKLKEFDLASFGSIGLESNFGAINKVLEGHLSTQEIVKLICHNPREIFNLPIGEIKEGESADLTIFDPSIEYTFEQNDIKSLSKNSAFLCKKLKGKVLGVVSNRKSFFN